MIDMGIRIHLPCFRPRPGEAGLRPQQRPHFLEKVSDPIYRDRVRRMVYGGHPLVARPTSRLAIARERREIFNLVNTVRRLEDSGRLPEAISLLDHVVQPSWGIERRALYCNISIKGLSGFKPPLSKFSVPNQELRVVLELALHMARKRVDQYICEVEKWESKPATVATVWPDTFVREAPAPHGNGLKLSCRLIFCLGDRSDTARMLKIADIWKKGPFPNDEAPHALDYAIEQFIRR